MATGDRSGYLVATTAPPAPAMTPSPLPPLSTFARKVHSQSGEDGIIGEILARIGASASLDRWCVEFGALDGVLYSNTCHLIRDQGYRAVLIEGDRKKYQELQRNLPQDEVVKICRFVTLEGDSTLDRILAETEIPADFDFLSIDIDGCDYHILDSLQRYRPKVVCIEYNFNIPNEVDFVQPADFAVKQGSSARALLRLAAGKGYALCAVTETNLLLVRAEYAAAVGTASLEALRNDEACRTLVFFGYDGTLLSNKETIRLPWHRLHVRPAQLQVLPRFLRRFGEDYGIVRKLLFAIFVLLRFPRDFGPLFREKVAGRKREPRK
jgi:hypothetical protein